MNITVGSDGLKNSMPQWGIEPQSLAFWVSVITTRPPRQLSTVTFTPLWGKHVLMLWPYKQVYKSPNWPPNVTVGSNRPKSSVPQWRIEPWSLAFQASIITARPPRQLSTVTFTPLWGKYVFTLRPYKQVYKSPNWPPNVTVGSNRPKSSMPQWGIEPWSLAFQASIITARPPRQLSAVTWNFDKYLPYVQYYITEAL